MDTQEKFKKQRGHLTQTKAAEAIGCPVATYRDWEQGRRNPPKWIRKIALYRLSEVAKTPLTETWDGCTTDAEVDEYIRKEILNTQNQ